MKGLTDRQKEILGFIEEYISQRGFPPTIREICRRFNISSTFGVKRHLEALRKKGFLTIESNLSRALTVVSAEKPDSPAASEQHGFSESGDTDLDPNVTVIPIVGRVAAGVPILAEENIEGDIRIDSAFVKQDSGYYALKVKGDSMIDAGIYEGDLVIVAPRHDPRNGEIVIAMLGDEATVKRFERRGNEVLLIAENPIYRPIEVKGREDFSIIGKVVGMLRWYN